MKTVYGLIKEAQEDIEKSLNHGRNWNDLTNAKIELQKAINSLDTEPNIYKVVRG
jgi:hypothetical protein